MTIEEQRKKLEKLAKKVESQNKQLKTHNEVYLQDLPDDATAKLPDHEKVAEYISRANNAVRAAMKECASISLSRRDLDTVSDTDDERDSLLNIIKHFEWANESLKTLEGGLSTVYNSLITDLPMATGMRPDLFVR